MSHPKIYSGLERAIVQETPAVYFSSVYGSTRVYAEALAHALGRRAVDITDGVPADEAQWDCAQLPLIFVGPVYGMKLLGADHAAEAAKAVDTDTASHKVAFVTVGLTDPDKAAAKDSSAKFFGEEKDRIRRFYVPGRLHYPELKRVHRTAIKGMLLYYSTKPGATPFEKELVASGGVGFDKVDTDKILPVVHWAQTR